MNFERPYQSVQMTPKISSKKTNTHSENSLWEKGNLPLGCHIREQLQSLLQPPWDCMQAEWG